MDWDVKTVRPLGGYRLSVETVGGRSGAFDMKPYLDRGYFNRVGIVFGAVTWPNGQDIAPETLLAGLVEGTAEVVGLEQAVRLEVVGVQIKGLTPEPAGIVLGAVTWPNEQDIAPETLLAGLVEESAEIQRQGQSGLLEVAGVQIKDLTP